MPREQGTRATRYETIIATLVGVSALFVSGYTAYVQRQQVRAQVWPILEYNTSNGPMIRFTLDNKGVGPGIIRHVVLKIDGEPVPNWQKAFEKLLGPLPENEKYHYSQSEISGHVMSAGESINFLIPHNAKGAELTGEESGPLWKQLDEGRKRVSIEVCYSSTLGECWTLRADWRTNSTMETRQCPKKSSISFQD